MTASKQKMSKREIRQRVKKAVKTEDGIIATLFSSKFSAFLLHFIGPSSITPNQVSVFSLVLSFIAAYLLYLGEYWALVAGAIMIQVHFIFDCLDGELARFQERPSIYGGWLDQMIDRISEFLFIMGLTWGVYNQTGDWWLWPLGSLAFFSLFMYYFSDAAISPLIRREQEKGQNIEVPVSMAQAGAATTADVLGDSQVSRMKRILVKIGVKGSFLSTILGRDMQLFMISLAAITNLTVPLFIFFSTVLNGYWILRSYRYWVRRMAG
ncbi:MAG: CDP-alcohol phosphatidyltransferase family protein [Thermincolia bacterium]